MKRPLVATLAVAAWAGAWALPWQGLLDFVPSLRSALALVLFGVPGFCVYVLLDDGRRASAAARLPGGLLLSVTVTGALGFAGSVAGLPTAIVDAGLWSAGALGLGLLAMRGELRIPRWRGGRPRALDALALAVVMLTAARLCLAPAMGADDMTYVARMTWFQQSPTLSFRGIVFGGEQLISPRDWLAFWPLCEAVIGSLGDVHGVQLTTLYLGPLLAPLAVLAVADLARALGLSRRFAVAAAALQVTILLLLHTRDQPGRHFFERLTEDKFLALYVLAPAVVRLVTDVLRGANARTLSALAAGWLGGALVHPTSLGILFLVVAAYAALEWIAVRGRAALLVLAVVVPITTAAAAVRFVPTPSRPQVYFDVEEAAQKNDMRGARARRVDMLEQGRFYGVGTSSAPPVARLLGALVLVAALLRARRERVARYVAAGFGIAALAIMPYTGWVLGRLLTPFHLWRILTAVPFGIGAAFVLRLAGSLGARAPEGLVARAAPAGPVLAVVLLLATVGYAAANERVFRLTSLRLPDGWSELLDARAKFDRRRLRFHHADLVAIARALDAAIDRKAVVLGDAEVNNLIPSLSAKAVLVAFRSPAQTAMHAGIDREEARARWKAYQQVTLGRTTPEATVRYLREHDVRFVLTAADADWFTSIPHEVLPRERIAEAGFLRLYRLPVAHPPAVS
jgi:hypothetical protein